MTPPPVSEKISPAVAVTITLVTELLLTARCANAALQGNVDAGQEKCTAQP